MFRFVRFAAGKLSKKRTVLLRAVLKKTTCFVNVKVGLIQKIENHPHSQVLRIEPVGAAEQEHSFLNVESEQQHCQTVNTETETAVRRTAVFKEFKVELNVFTESFFVRLFFEDFVTILAPTFIALSNDEL